MHSDVLAETCNVSTRKENPIDGFQRTLDVGRANEIANYLDNEGGTIPNSIVLSAQEEAKLKIVGRGKTLEFSRVPGAFLILDGQHRVYGFALAETVLRVPVVIYNGLSRKDETRLFIDINTKQRPVPSQLLLDIKHLAEMETEDEEMLRDIFDQFDQDSRSVLNGFMSPSEKSRSKLTRVTFNQSMKPMLSLFPGREPFEIFEIMNAYLSAFSAEISKRTKAQVLSRPVVFRGLIAVFPTIAQRVQDRHGSKYTAANFQEIIQPIFPNMPAKKLESPGSSWTAFRDYLESRLKTKLTL